MDENALVLLITFSITTAFAIGFFFVIYKIVSAMSERKTPSAPPRWTKEELNTIVP